MLVATKQVFLVKTGSFSNLTKWVLYLNLTRA